jgi:hypothetical protein
MVGNLYIFNSETTMIKNHYFRFFIKIIIILIILIVADQITGRVLRHFYFNNLVAGEHYQANFCLYNTNSDILVFGSSRASHHYASGLFEKNLKMSFYNTGRDGNFFLYNYAVFKVITKRYSPKIIIFDINPNELIYRKDDYEKLSTLLPYYQDHPELRDIIKLRGPFEEYKLYSAIYPFNSLLTSIGIESLQISKTRYTSDKGYLPLYNKMKGIKANNALQKTVGTIDQNKLNALNDIALTCKNKNIRLLLVFSPIYNNSTESPATKIIENIANSENCQYFDFSNDSTYDNHPEYFQDNVHLNDDGAKIFSNILSEKLMEKLNVKY